MLFASRIVLSRAVFRELSVHSGCAFLGQPFETVTDTDRFDTGEVAKEEESAILVLRELRLENIGDRFRKHERSNQRVHQWPHQWHGQQTKAEQRRTTCHESIKWEREQCRLGRLRR